MPRQYVEEGREETVLRVSPENIVWFSKPMEYFRNPIENLSMEGQRQPVYRSIYDPVRRLHFLLLLK